MSNKNERFSWPSAKMNQAVQTTPSLLNASQPKSSGQPVPAPRTLFLQDNPQQHGASSQTVAKPHAGIDCGSTDELDLKLSEESDDETGGATAEKKPHGRKKLTDQERQKLREKFDHLGRNRNEAKDIENALDDPQFFNMFQEIKNRKELDNVQTRKLLQESYIDVH